MIKIIGVYTKFKPKTNFIKGVLLLKDEAALNEYKREVWKNALRRHNRGKDEKDVIKFNPEDAHDGVLVTHADPRHEVQKTDK